MTTVRDYLKTELRKRGAVRNFYQFAVAEHGQDWAYSYAQLSELERRGVVSVSHSGHGTPLDIVYLREESMTTTIVALDPGFGNTKVCVGGKTATLQSAVARPVTVGLAANGMKVADTATRITFDEAEYVTGRGAWMWGRPLGSMDFAGIAGPERRALMYAAISALMPAGDLGDVRLVIGLPVPLMQDDGQMASVKESLKGIKRRHQWDASGEYTMNVVGVSILNQPAGAFFDWAYNDDLAIREGAFTSDVAVVDLGMNTLDLFVMQSGEVRPGYLGGDKAGARRLLELHNGNGHDVQELDDQLRNGRLKISETAMQLWLGEVLGVIEKTWPSLRRFKAVIPTGGGAMVLDRRLHNALAAKGAAIHWPPDPVSANVRGLYKHGIKHAK